MKRRLKGNREEKEVVRIEIQSDRQTDSRPRKRRSAHQQTSKLPWYTLLQSHTLLYLLLLP
jgi:hypothetical protein